MRLVNAQDSVQTISEAVGFADASYFSRIFQIRRPHAHGVPEIPDRAVRPQKSPEKDLRREPCRSPRRFVYFIPSGIFVYFVQHPKQKTDE